MVGDVSWDEVIFFRQLVISNEGYTYKREATLMIDVFGLVGGLLSGAIAVGAVFYALCVEPVRDMDQAFSFSKMKS